MEGYLLGALEIPHAYQYSSSRSHRDTTGYPWIPGILQYPSSNTPSALGSQHPALGSGQIRLLGALLSREIPILSRLARPNFREDKNGSPETDAEEEEAAGSGRQQGSRGGGCSRGSRLWRHLQLLWLWTGTRALVSAAEDWRFRCQQAAGYLGIVVGPADQSESVIWASFGTRCNPAMINEPGFFQAPRLTHWAMTCSFDALRISTRTGWRSSDGRAQYSGPLNPVSKDLWRIKQPTSGFGRARPTRKESAFINTTTNPTLAFTEPWSY